MIVFDIETAALPDDILRTLYTEPTWEEFSFSCDQRWKEETKREKFEAAKGNGWHKFQDGAALSPLTGRVLAIGFRSAKGSMIEDGGGDESALLDKFWATYVKCRAKAGGPVPMVGWNIQGFDLPFLIRRSWLHQVDVPQAAFDGQRFDQLFIDLMPRFTPGGWKEYVKLDTAAKFFGMNGKPAGVNGGDFAKLWLGTAEEKEKAVAYLKNDLDMAATVAMRMGVAI